MTPSELGPVSATLEADLRTTGSAGTASCSGSTSTTTTRTSSTGSSRMKAAGAIPYEVRAFRGSHLALMLDLEALDAGVEKTPLVIHLPGFNEETVRETPLLELYFAGRALPQGAGHPVNEAAGARSVPSRSRPSATAARSRSQRPTPGSRTCSPTATAGSAHSSGPSRCPPSSTTCSAVASSPAGSASVEDRGRSLGAFRRLDRASRQLARRHAPAGHAPRRGRGVRRRELGACVEYADDLKRPPVAARLQAARGPAAPGHRRLPRPRGPSPGAARGLLPPDGGRDGGAPRRRGRGGPGRGPREDRHLPVRGGQGPRGGARGRSGAATGQAAWPAWACGPRRRRVVLAPRRPVAAVRLAARPPTRPVSARRSGRAATSLDARGDMERAIERYAVARCRRSTRPTGTWSSGGRPCSTRRCPSSRSLRARLDRMRVALARLGRPLGASTSTRSARHAASCRTPGSSSGRSSTRWSGRSPRSRGRPRYFVVDALRFEMGEELFAPLDDTPATTRCSGPGSPSCRP